MDIYFGLHYTSNAFVDMKMHQGICLDHTVVNLDGLLSLLELHLGLHHKDINHSDRQVAYYKALRKVMGMERNILSDSWNKNELGVSNECLKWRDALRMCGWRYEMKQPSERLTLLAKVEPLFQSPALGDRLERVLLLLQDRNPLPKNSRIFVAAKDACGLPPTLVHLLQVLQSLGTAVVFEEDVILAPKNSNLAKIQQLTVNGCNQKLKQNDKSVQIWEFTTELDAARFVASQDKESFDAYILSNNKLFDHVQRLLKQPSSGSSVPNAHAQMSQLFKVGMRLFAFPFNIRNLVSWLLMPFHPIKSNLRRKLVDVLLRTGGYQNKEYDKAIEDYINKIREENTDTAAAELEIEKVKHSMKLFLPSPQAEGVDKQVLLNFIKGLGDWCGMMTNLMDIDENIRLQLAQLTSLCRSMLSLVIDEEDGAWIPYQRLESWTNAIYSGTNLTIYPCEAGSRHTLTAADLVEDTQRIVWMDCYNSAIGVEDTQFLNALEKTMLTDQGCLFWDETNFNRAMMREVMRPVLKCRKQLVLIVTKIAQGKPTEKHPLIICMEQAFGDSLAHITIQPNNKKSEKKTIQFVDNKTYDMEIRFKNNHLISMPLKESFTSLDNLIQYPLDYVIEYILKLRNRSSTSLSAINKVKGNVAHAVIEHLFQGQTEAIEQKIVTEYDDTLTRITKEKGAILMLQENVVEWHFFKNNLKKCLDALIGIIKANQLTVVNRELYIEQNIKLLQETENDPLVKGFVDMILKKPNGDLVVFDFKWTNSANIYSKRIKKNEAIQLALYEHLVNRIAKYPVVATAFFTMPEHKLLTSSDAIAVGQNVEHIKPENEDSLILKIKNSYCYRREQLLNGIIEYAENIPLDQIPYALDQEDKGLVPLTSDDKNPIHPNNRFSIFSNFK